MIELSRAAIDEINRLRTRHPNQSAFLRLQVASGGCSGLLYITKFEDELRSDDRLIECDGIQIAIDPSSSPYLNGLALDFSDDLMGGSFRFHNPNAKKNCGCGVSFSIDES